MINFIDRINKVFSKESINPIKFGHYDLLDEMKSKFHMPEFELYIYHDDSIKNVKDSYSKFNLATDPYGFIIFTNRLKLKSEDIDPLIVRELLMFSIRTDKLKFELDNLFRAYYNICGQIFKLDHLIEVPNGYVDRIINRPFKMNFNEWKLCIEMKYMNNNLIKI